MEKAIFRVLFSFAIIGSLVAIGGLVFVSSSAFAMKVVIDPGHGGTDRGAVRGSIAESEITLAVAKLVYDELKTDKSFTPTLTRVDDTYIPLEERVEIANRKGDIFLSIHVNSSTDSHARGKEIYFQNQLPSDEESMFLASRENDGPKTWTHAPLPMKFDTQLHPEANSDVRTIVEDLERNHRLKLSGIFTEHLYKHWGGEIYRRKLTVRQAPFFVISNIKKPGALIEIGYISNPEEAKKLSDPVYQKKIAHGIYEALLSFQAYLGKNSKGQDPVEKETMDNPETKSLN